MRENACTHVRADTTATLTSVWAAMAGSYVCLFVTTHLISSHLLYSLPPVPPTSTSSKTVGPIFCRPKFRAYSKVNIVPAATTTPPVAIVTNGNAHVQTHHRMSSKQS
uniref:Uncharacterized protein n=1 Tax=Anopheles maculatus TaxID=74869 RepID=A0A182TCM8_9DIPT